MRAKLRTWMGSWRVYVTIGCLVYLGLLYKWGPVIEAVWPRGLVIAQWLMLLALCFLGDVLARYVLAPFLVFSLGDKKFPNRTPKAKEKAADSLMSVGTAVGSAVWISLLVFPLTAFIQVMAGGTDPVSALVSWWRPDRWSSWHTGVFCVLFFLPLSMSRQMQRRALDIYDEISPPPSLQPTPTVDQRAQGTNEQPHLSTEVKRTHPSANGGARRRRRPHVK
jgi:hypothetical protein